MSSDNNGNRKKKYYNKSRVGKNKNSARNGSDENTTEEKSSVKSTADNQTSEQIPTCSKNQSPKKQFNGKVTGKATNIIEKPAIEQTSICSKNSSPKKHFYDKTTDKSSNSTVKPVIEQTPTCSKNLSPRKHLNGKNKINTNEQQQNVPSSSLRGGTRDNNQNTQKKFSPSISVQSTPHSTRLYNPNSGAIPKSSNYIYRQSRPAPAAAPAPTHNSNVTLPMYHPQSARFHHPSEQPTQLSLINRSLQNLQISEAHDNGTRSRRELLLSGQPLPISHLLTTQEENAYQQQSRIKNRPLPYSQVLASGGHNNPPLPQAIGHSFSNQGYHPRPMYPQQRPIMIPQHAMHINNPPLYATYPPNLPIYQTMEQMNTPSPIAANIPRTYSEDQIKELEMHQMITKRNLYDAIAESYRRPFVKENRSVSLDVSQLSVSQNHPPLLRNSFNLPPLGEQFERGNDAIFQRVLVKEELERRETGGSERPVGMGANGIFTRRLDFSSFNKLSKKKHNSYDIKMEDEGNHGNDETRCFILSTLAGMNRPRVHCILCDEEMLVFDRYPLVDGTFFLSPRKHNHSCIEVQQDMRTLYLGAVCMSCLEAKDTSRAIYCCKCGTQWKGSSLVLGTCYSYDIFAAMPCCIDRFNCNTCFQPLLSYNQRLNYFSDYSRLTNCPHCKTPDYHFVKPLAYWYTREQIQLYRQWP